MRANPGPKGAPQSAAIQLRAGRPIRRLDCRPANLWPQPRARPLFSAALCVSSSCPLRRVVHWPARQLASLPKGQLESLPGELLGPEEPKRKWPRGERSNLCPQTVCGGRIWAARTRKLAACARSKCTLTVRSHCAPACNWRPPLLLGRNQSIHITRPTLSSGGPNSGRSSAANQLDGPKDRPPASARPPHCALHTQSRPVAGSLRQSRAPTRSHRRPLASICGQSRPVERAGVEMGAERAFLRRKGVHLGVCAQAAQTVHGPPSPSDLIQGLAGRRLADARPPQLGLRVIVLTFRAIQLGLLVKLYRPCSSGSSALGLARARGLRGGGAEGQRGARRSSKRGAKRGQKWAGRSWARGEACRHNCIGASSREREGRAVSCELHNGTLTPIGRVRAIQMACASALLLGPQVGRRSTAA